MPVTTSTRRYSTTIGSHTYLPPSGGSITSSGLGSSNRSNSASNSSYKSGTTYFSRSPSSRCLGLYNSSSSLIKNSIYTPKDHYSSSLSKLSSETSNRYGVSNYPKSIRPSVDREITKGIEIKTFDNNNINTYKTKTLQTKPPIGIGYKRCQRSESRSHDSSISRLDKYTNSFSSNNDKISDCINNNIHNNNYQTKFSSSRSGLTSTTGINYIKQNSSSLSSKSPSFVKKVDTSGLDIYEKYSPAYYIPKCELSRSRSLSETTVNFNDSLDKSSNTNIQDLLQHQIGSTDTRDLISTTQLAYKVKTLSSNTNSNNCITNNNFAVNSVLDFNKTQNNTSSAKKLYTAANNKTNLPSSQINSNKTIISINKYEIQNVKNDDFNRNHETITTINATDNIKQRKSTNGKSMLNVLNKTLKVIPNKLDNQKININHVNGNDFLQSAKLNLRSTTKFSSNNIDEKAMTSPYHQLDLNSSNNKAKNVFANNLLNHTQTKKTTNCSKFENNEISQHQFSTYKNESFLKDECALARSQVTVKENEINYQNNSSNEENNVTKIIAKNDYTDKCDKNLIKPIVHKTINKKLSIKTNKGELKNNMNYLQNSSDVLDEIKYIDSDDSVFSSISRNLEKNDKNITVRNNMTSTFPLTSKQRDVFHKDKNKCMKTSSTNKYNTLNDSKKLSNSSPINIIDQNLHQRNKTQLSSIPSKTTINITNSYNSSKQSTPSASPQIIRRKNFFNNSFNQAYDLSTSSSSTTNFSNDKKGSNKLCDIDENVRNASIKSGLNSEMGSLKKSESKDFPTIKSLSSYDSFEKSSPENREGLCGLRNIGNTCFMNSVIQCLSHTRELTRFLKTQTYTKQSLSKDQQILCEFSKLIREMWNPSVRSIAPLELKNAFSSKHRMYSGYNQQDAQEFLRFFLDSLHCALNTGTKGEALKLEESLSDNRKADLTWEWYSKIENSVIKDFFVGQLKSTLRCTVCGNTSVTFDPFWDLSVPLPSSSRCKLDACLEFFNKEEVLDGDEMPTCSKCQKRRKSTKTFTIQRFPKYLVIHLKRFSEARWSKLSNIVEFPVGERELNMAPYAANSSTTAYYTLYAISNHMGSTAGGHYVALCKHPKTRQWHEFNDNSVSESLPENSLVSSSAYLLFYERE